MDTRARARCCPEEVVEGGTGGAGARGGAVAGENGEGGAEDRRRGAAWVEGGGGYKVGRRKSGTAVSGRCARVHGRDEAASGEQVLAHTG